MDNQVEETGCCPRFNPDPWQEKEITWQDMLFLKDQVRSFLHIPLSFGKVMAKNMAVIEEAGALAPQPLMLTDDKSPWRTDIYIAVGKEVPGAEMVRMSGTFLTKVFEGPFRDAGKWMREMKGFVKSKGKESDKLYLSYTTCPSCAKAYGKNYAIIFAAV
ncbi:MAG: hypothetical protein HW388_4 [Dehalococcoidia bacterium]|nr:hypothetical protein [Dehalococcoidia bacterium]